jgi:hypothetical protein
MFGSGRRVVGSKEHFVPERFDYPSTVGRDEIGYAAFEASHEAR